MRRFKYRLLVANAVLLVVLAASVWAGGVDRAPLAGTLSLKSVNVPFRGWKTTDLSLSRGELAMLEPDAVLLRQYRSASGDLAQLAVIAGHLKKTVHTPEFCMSGDGWETLARRRYRLVGLGQDIPATRAVMVHDGQRVVVTYFFTDGGASTDSLIEFQWRQFVERVRSHIPVGALIRLIVPVREDLADAESLSDDFGRAVIPPVLIAIHRAQIEALSSPATPH